MSLSETLTAVAIAALVGLAVWALSQDRTATALPDPTGALTPSGLLGGSATDGFARAVEPRPFVFPDDHGPHPSFRTEWWYFTGNLHTVDDPERHFGFQVTFFRYALQPREPTPRDPETSAWRSNDVYMAHVALTDTASGRHLHDERFSRAALGLAGVELRPFRAWLGPWQAAGAGEDLFPLRVAIQTDRFSLDLLLDTNRPPVLHGDRGLSAKSSAPGNASYYYSYTRIDTTGAILLDDHRFGVKGSAWLDREWSTSALGPDQAGWDWFALQLDDGSDLMFYRLRRHNGTASPQSAGALFRPGGRKTKLDAEDVELEILRHWRSPETGIEWPVAWQLRVPKLDLNLDVEPRIDNQEMRVSVLYWEGAVTASGSRQGRRVGAVGYLELAGYR